MAEDYYSTLGISRSASQDEILKAYRRLARKYHPDLNPDDEKAKRQFQAVQVAYDTLQDPEKRKLYDQFGEGYEAYRNNPFGAGKPGPAGFDFREAFEKSEGFQFFDFFKDAASDSQASGKTQGSSARSRRSGASSRTSSFESDPHQPGDVAAEIPVPLRIMVEGGEVQFRLNRGDGRIEDLSVKIPADVTPGKKIRLRGLGERNRSGETGDLILTIQLQPHHAIKINGNNIELKLPITLSEAIYGAKIDVPSLGGDVTIRIPTMCDSGKRLRVKGQGLKGPNGLRGDMIIEPLIQLPEEIPESLGSVIKQFESTYDKNLRDGIRW
ncbi:MAG: DnaJ C-terminal domain-containing protein [Planctomycetota bacterium]|jgi:DnaJ-class molecular chaperone